MINPVKNEFSQDFLTDLIEVGAFSVIVYSRSAMLFVSLAVLFFFGLFHAPLLWLAIGGISVVGVQYYRLRTAAAMISLERRLETSQVRQGQAVKIIFKVWNRSAFSYPPFLLKDYSFYLRSVGGGFHGCENGLKPNQAIEIVFEKTCEAPLGPLELGAFEIKTQDELGIFQFSRLFADQKALQVRPPLTSREDGPDLEADRSPLPGDIETTVAGEGVSLHGLREYRDGDPLNSICWKKQLHDDDFFVKQYEANITRRVAVVLASDPTAHLGYGASSTWELAKNHALLIIRKYLDLSSSLSMVTPTIQIIDVAGLQNLPLFENELAHARLPEDPAAAGNQREDLDLAVLHLQPPTLLYYILPFHASLEKTLLPRLHNLKADGFQPVLVLVAGYFSAGQVRQRFGSFKELGRTQTQDLTDLLQKLHANSIDTYCIGARDLTGGYRVYRGKSHD